MDRIKKGEYEFFGEAPLISETDKVEKEIAGKIYTIEKLLLKDYRNKKITEWNQKRHSILTTEITVLHEGKKVVHESKYDTGYPPDGIDVSYVARNICGSAGMTSHTVTEKDPLLGAQVVQIDTPPSVMFIIETHMFYILGEFEKIAKEEQKSPASKQEASP